VGLGALSAVVFNGNLPLVTLFRAALPRIRSLSWPQPPRPSLPFEGSAAPESDDQVECLDVAVGLWSAPPVGGRHGAHRGVVDRLENLPSPRRSVSIQPVVTEREVPGKPGFRIRSGVAGVGLEPTTSGL
jgi:hypothetical protein